MSENQSSALGQLLTEYDSKAHSESDRNWLRGFLQNIALEAQSGRMIPLVAPAAPAAKSAAKNAAKGTAKGTAKSAGPAASTADIELWQTEGAILDLVRATVDGHDSLLIEHVEFLGDVSQSGASVGVSLTAVVLVETTPQGAPKVPALSASAAADRARTRIREALARHSQLRVGAIDVTITDVIVLHAAEDADE